MKREIAYYQLPDSVKIARDSPGASLADARESLEQAQREVRESWRTARQKCLALHLVAALFFKLLKDVPASSCEASMEVRSSNNYTFPCP
eukprot:1123915-Amphidinium_carterae.1